MGGGGILMIRKIYHPDLKGHPSYTRRGELQRPKNPRENSHLYTVFFLITPPGRGYLITP
jgi:hypothetical protein